MKGTWTATEASAQLVAANPLRQELVLQHQGGDPVYLLFGAGDAEVEGVRLSADVPAVSIDDKRAKMRIAGICSAGKSANGGWQDDLEF